MEGENLIHVRLEHNEVFESKKDILTMQMNILRMLKAMKEYKILRTEELKLKEKLARKIKEVKKELANLKQAIPHVKIPEFLKKESFEDEINETKPTKKEISFSGDLESQLEEIQNKLKEMQG